MVVAQEPGVGNETVAGTGWAWRSDQTRPGHGRREGGPRETFGLKVRMEGV